MENKISKEEYEIIIRSVFEKIISELDTEADKSIFDDILEKLIADLTENMESSPSEIFNVVTEEYLDKVRAIAKLSPGLSTGLRDTKYGITLNTLSGKTSQLPNADEVSEDTVFDSSSVTKLFTAILLLKEAEAGRIDLNKKISELSPLLKGMDESLLKTLKFGTLVRTDGLITEEGLSKEERLEKLLNAKTLPGKGFEYNDIQYMLVPFLFGDTVSEATDNYLKKFYELYRGIGLSQTGYSTINMSGGNVALEHDKDNNTFNYRGLEIFDPKAHMAETELGLVPAHAGVTTTIRDLEKLFEALNNGLLSEESMEILTTTIYPESIYLLDDNGDYILDARGNKIKVNHAMGVYPHIADVTISDIADGPSKSAFAAEGSTEAYFLFDRENGISYGYLPNIRSGLYSVLFNVDDYDYGMPGDVIKQGHNTLHLGSAALIKGSMNDGKLERGEGKFNMPFVRETNNFKEEQFEAILKLRVAKLAQLVKANIENNGQDYEKAKEEIERAFNRSDYQKVMLKKAENLSKAL